MSAIHEEARKAARALWTSSALDELATISRRVRCLDAFAAAGWLDGFLQELRSVDGPQRICSAALLSKEHDARASIVGYISAREGGLVCKLVGKKPNLLRAVIRREIERRCPIPWDALDRAGRMKSIALLCEEVIDHTVPWASGFEVTLPTSRDPWDSVALRVALAGAGTVLLLTFKDYD